MTAQKSRGRTTETGAHGGAADRVAQGAPCHSCPATDPAAGVVDDGGGDADCQLPLG